jgi:hypothetical protein
MITLCLCLPFAAVDVMAGGVLKSLDTVCGGCRCGEGVLLGRRGFSRAPELGAGECISLRVPLWEALSDAAPLGTKPEVGGETPLETSLQVLGATLLDAAPSGT